MNALNQQVSEGDEFAIPQNQQPPGRRQERADALGMDWASRQTAPSEEPAPQPKLGAYPIPN
jgi:hypothetical protein